MDIQPPVPPKIVVLLLRHPCLPRGASLEHGGKSLVGDADWARCLRVMGRLFPQPFAAGQVGVELVD